jgi:cation transporter-like permease
MRALLWFLSIAIAASHLCGYGGGTFVMILLLKIALTLFMLFWLGVAVWLLVRCERLFGCHPDDPAETPGARTLNLTQVWSCWLGVFAIAGYFLFR